VLGEGPVERSAREDGVRWLLACPATAHDTCADLANLREEVRRRHPDDSSHHEVLNVRHFTASWIVRALLTPGAQEIARQDGVEDTWRERLNGAAAAVWAAQTDGIWSWNRDGSVHDDRGNAPAHLDDLSRAFGAARTCRMDVSAGYSNEAGVSRSWGVSAWVVGRSWRRDGC
jgi:hypothetical protein